MAYYSHNEVGAVVICICWTGYCGCDSGATGCTGCGWIGWGGGYPSFAEINYIINMR